MHPMLRTSVAHAYTMRSCACYTRSTHMCVGVRRRCVAASVRTAVALPLQYAPPLRCRFSTRVARTSTTRPAELRLSCALYACSPGLPCRSGVLRCAPVCSGTLRSNRPRAALPNYTRPMCVSIVYLSQEAHMCTTRVTKAAPCIEHATAVLCAKRQGPECLPGPVLFP